MFDLKSVWNVSQMEGNEITNTALDAIQWADGILLVYSITDRQSFNYIKRAKIEIQSDIPVSLVGLSYLFHRFFLFG